jgi:hypothetical protein
MLVDQKTPGAYAPGGLPWWKEFSARCLHEQGSEEITRVDNFLITSDSPMTIMENS